MLETWMRDAFTVKQLGNWLLLNDIEKLSSDHLWYLYAVIYSLVILRLCDKYHQTKTLYYFTPIMWLTSVIYDYDVQHILIIRNFMFYGIPCVTCGRIMREIQVRVRYRNHFFTNRTILMMALFSLALCYAEYLMRLHGATGGIREIYICTLPLALTILWAALQNPTFGKGTIFALIGQRYSAYIYIFHELIIDITRTFLQNYNDSMLLKIAYPILVFCLSYLFSMFYVKAKNFTIKQRKIWLFAKH